MSAQCFEWRDRAFQAGAAVPLEDRGFRYGMAVFETIMVRNGRAEFFEPHLDRLRAACVAAEFPLPEDALACIGDLLSGFDGVARIYVTAGSGRFDAPTATPALYVMLETTPAPPRADSYALCDRLHRIAPPLPGIKSCNYWPHILALRRAHLHGCDEGLLVNAEDEVVSAAMANVFLVRDGEIMTPTLASGARAGVIREWIIQQRKVTERAIHPDELNCAEEIFLTSSGLRIMPVSRLGERALPSRSIASELATELELHDRQAAR